VAYDAAWGYELGYIVKDGLRRMYGPTEGHPDGEDIFYYLTLYNEPYVQPAEPADYPGGSAALEQGVLRGLYRYAPAPAASQADETAQAEQAEQAEHAGQDADSAAQPRAQILASGVAMRWALEAQRLLAEDWGVGADVWSATSWTQLRRNALCCEEWNMLHPGGCRPRTARWAPTGTASPTPAPPPAGSSTWTRSPSRWRC
jgi:pyruvate dehydrogenase E1 component